MAQPKERDRCKKGNAAWQEWKIIPFLPVSSKFCHDYPMLENLFFDYWDTICMPGKKFCYEGIPTFAPEHFARVRQLDTMKRKQFIKGISEIAQEGAIQIFQEFNTGMEEIIVGVVGVLQFDVLKYRLENEYNVDIRLENLPYEYIRWIDNPQDFDLAKLSGTSDMKKVKDLKDRPLLLFVNEWSIRMTQERNDGLVLTEFAR